MSHYATNLAAKICIYAISPLAGPVHDQPTPKHGAWRWQGILRGTTFQN